MSVHDQAAIARVWNQAVNGGTVDPVDTLQALAALSSSEVVDRLDRRVYLLTLKQLVAEGLTNGIFPAVYGYLVNVGNAEDAITLQSDIFSGTHYSFLQSASDGPTGVTLGTCPNAAAADGVRAAYDGWTRTRGTAPFAKWRNELLTGQPLDLASLDHFVAKLEACTTASSPSALVKLRDEFALLLGAAHVVDFNTQYSLPALAAAALLDYVRTRDATQLDKNIRALLLFGSTRVALFVANRSLAAHPLFSTAQDVLRSCEYQTLERQLGLPVTSNAADPSKCYSLLDAPNGLALSTQCPLKVGTPPARCPMTPAPAAAAFPAAAVAAALSSVEQRLQSLETGDPLLRDVISGLNVNELVRAVTDLENGDTSGAQRELVRLGIDFMVNEVDSMSLSMLGVTDADCSRDTQSESIFSGLGAACAVHVLLEGAYHPVADWYFQQGASGTDTSSVATSVYRNLLGNPALDTTPIILNVGLGGTFVAGGSDWGNGYAAMTLIDKIGLAFYKYSWTDFRFETGPFAGGFLDALIRTAASDGTAQRYWLLGYTAGFPRMWSTDLGLELHVAAAMPFTLSDSNHYGVALGGALVVPFNFVFQQGGP